MNIKIKGGPLFSPFTLVLCWECGCYVKNTDNFSFVHRKVSVKISFFFVLCSFSFLICLFVLVFFQCFLKIYIFSTKKFAMAIAKVFLVSCFCNGNGKILVHQCEIFACWIFPYHFVQQWSWSFKNVFCSM